MGDPATSQSDYPPLSPFVTGLRGRCPRCGNGKIFVGLLELKSRCDACGFDLSAADTGDGPSFFVSFIGGFLVLGAGIVAQVAYDPAVWVYVVLLAIGALLCIGMLRPVKGLLTALQYTNKASPGVVDP